MKTLLTLAVLLAFTLPAAAGAPAPTPVQKVEQVEKTVQNVKAVKKPQDAKNLQKDLKQVESLGDGLTGKKKPARKKARSRTR